MSLAITPSHQETGISLPVVIHPEDFVISRPNQHHSEHPSIREELKDEMGQALRASRIQLLPEHMHQGAYPGGLHRFLWGPEVVPKDSWGKLVKMCLHLAMVIPRTGIVITEEGVDTRDLSDDEHAFVSHPRVTRPEGRNARRQHSQAIIGSALIKYAILNQEIEEMFSPRTVETFLNTLDYRRERELGNQIIRTAVNETILPILPLVEDARNEGLIDPRHAGLQAVVRRFVKNDDMGSHYEVLRQRLLRPMKPLSQIETLPMKANEDIELAA